MQEVATVWVCKVCTAGMQVSLGVLFAGDMSVRSPVELCKGTEKKRMFHAYAPI